MSTARTTPAQKPRGFSSKTRFVALSEAEVGTGLAVEVFTPPVYRLRWWIDHHFDPNMVQLRNRYKTPHAIKTPVRGTKKPPPESRKRPDFNNAFALDMAPATLMR